MEQILRELYDRNSQNFCEYWEIEDMRIMFNFYTVKEWEDYLEKSNPQALIYRRRNSCKINWKPFYIIIHNHKIEELDCEEWIEEYCEGNVWKKYTHQYEFQLKRDALLFKLTWSKG